jgi:pimeloyl-ACP methyl ester carboxylesterase
MIETTDYAGDVPAPDGETLRWRRTGTGAPLLVDNGLVSSTQHWPWFVSHFRRRNTVITWDYRGHGGAPAPADLGTVSVESFAADGHCVLQAAAAAPAIVAALSFGVQVALEHYRAHPEDVRALVLICGTYGHPLDRLSRAPMVRRAAAAAARAFGRGGRLSAAALHTARTPISREIAFLTGGAHRELCPREVLDGLFAHVAAMDPRVVGNIVGAYFEHTAEDVLPRIAVPTLILAGDRDELTPVSRAERMHRMIRGSKLVVYPGHSHLVQVERPAAVHAEIERFLDEAGVT